MGAKLVGYVTALVMIVVILSCITTLASFFPDRMIEESFLVNATDGASCQLGTNCTQSLTGGFVGVLSGESFLEENIYMDFKQDCSDANVDVTFFKVFGVLFSGITGILAGANMSGELKNPGKAIPRGSLSALAFTFGWFALLMSLTALTCERALIYNDCLYLEKISLWPPSVTIGAFFITFSATFSHLIGASRVLEAVAKDVLFGPFLNFVIVGRFGDNPVAAVVLTWLFVQGFFFFGGLNAIAQLVSVLFLLSYAAVNVSCLGLHLASAPNFRPSFKFFSWHTCLCGVIGTTVMMFLINPVLSALSILLCVSLVFGLSLFSPAKDANWGSISQALMFHQVRKYLLLMDPRKAHIKFWRPQILLLVKNPRTSCTLIDFVNTMKKGGLFVLGHIHEENLDDTGMSDPSLSNHEQWLSYIDHLNVKAFVELTSAKYLRDGIRHLVRLSGIGAMKPNTVLLGFKDNEPSVDELTAAHSSFSTMKFQRLFPLNSHLEETKQSSMEYVSVIKDCLTLQKNVGLCRNFQSLNRSYLGQGSGGAFLSFQSKRKKYLDVWLVDFLSPYNVTNITDTTSLFILQLASIVGSVPRWSKLSMRIFTFQRGLERKDEEQKLKRMLDILRIKAKTDLLPGNHKSEDEKEYMQEMNELVMSRSKDTAVVFLYMPCLPHDDSKYPEFLDLLTKLTNFWPPTIIVRGVSPVMTTTL